MNKTIIMVIAIFLGGCAGTGSVKSVAQLKEENKALVVGDTPSTAKTLLAVGNRISIKFKAANGKRLERSAWSGWPNEVELTAGKHELLVFCSGNVSTVQLEKEFPMSIEVEAGHKYLVKPVLTGRTCIGKIEDITNI